MLSIFRAKIVERTETISTEIRSIQFNSLSDAYYRKKKKYMRSGYICSDRNVFTFGLRVSL